MSDPEEEPEPSEDSRESALLVSDEPDEDR